MVIIKSKQKKFESDLKIKLCGKRVYPKVLNTWVWKLIQTIAGNIMLMIFPLNWFAPMLSFSKLENMVLKYWDPPILQFLTLTYPAAVLPGLRTIAIFEL